MAEEANVQETVNDTVDTPADPAPEPGGDVQATETETPAGDTDPKPEPEKPVEKTYDEKYVKKLRDEAAAARVKGKEAAEQAAKEAAEKAQRDLSEQIGRALGLIKDDTPPDPAELLKQAQDREAQLAAERDAAAQELRSLRIEKALNAAADKCDGDTTILVPYLAGTGALKNLDPSADDFASQVEQIVSAAVEFNPKLKKAQDRVSAPRSGGDLTGGNAAPKPNAAKSIDDIRREMRAKRERDGI
ncbi:hypothetical protein [Nocardia otitidiscaviarum]|uniref:hypothetical protein n=1 Tax=Nocardia otitidiscaviarum TaxID=1823 RepID=UPI0006946DA5|nr:hypothetical protein [Nocardia otitidiscaviarum]